MHVLPRPRRPLRVLATLAVLALGLGILTVTSTAEQARAAESRSSLSAGQTLQPGQSLRSRSGTYLLKMQSNGNLVLSVDPCSGGVSPCPSPLQPRWALGTAGQPGNSLVMQRNGNLVLRSSTGRVVWATMTQGTGSANVLVVQDNSNLVVRSGGRAVWSSGTVGTYAHVAGQQVGDLRSQNGRYSFAAPGNGLSVWTRSGSLLWNVHALDDPRVDGDAIGRLVLRYDGNLVWYQPGKRGGEVAVWSSGTGGTGPTTHLVMENDGNLVLYDLWHRMLWSYKTGRVRR